MAPMMLLISLAVFVLGTSAEVSINCESESDEPRICLRDFTPYCLLSGRTVYGHCDLQRAVCDEGENYDPDYTACQDLPYMINCDNPGFCAMDYTHYCMMSGRSVYGHCGLQQAVCDDGDTWDPTYACMHLPYLINCDQTQFCLRDLLPHCMASGETVHGHCELQTEICEERDWYAYPGPCVEEEEDK